MSRFTLSLIALVVFVSFVSEAVKMTPQMEKCGEQLLMVLAKESNKDMKTIMNKLIKNVQGGNLKASQEQINSLTADQKQYANDKYWVDSCASMKSCLECPVEL